jgi:hypothetical protein
MPKFFYVSKWKLFLVAAVISVGVAISCTKQSDDVLKAENGGGSCDTTGMRYSLDVLPILEANCYNCHANGIVNGGVSLDGYRNVVLQVQNGKLVPAITHAPGVIPMPFDGGKLSDCNIAKIEAWINEGSPDN